MLAEITPKPDQITVAIGSSQYDVTSMMSADDVAGTHMADPKVIWNYSQMVADATPEFYIAHVSEWAGIEAWLLRQVEHALGDDVALNLVGATGDRNRGHRDQNFRDDSVARAFASGEHRFGAGHQRMHARAARARRGWPRAFPASLPDLAAVPAAGRRARDARSTRPTSP